MIVEVLSKSTEPHDGFWRYRVMGTGGRIELTMGTLLAVDDIFEGAFNLPGGA